jgi:hypothetical protein
MCPRPRVYTPGQPLFLRLRWAAAVDSVQQYRLFPAHRIRTLLQMAGTTPLRSSQVRYLAQRLLSLPEAAHQLLAQRWELVFRCRLVLVTAVL